MSYVNPLTGRIRQAFDSDQGRELTDGMTQHERSELIKNLLDLDIYEICERDKFYKSLSKEDRTVFRKMMLAGLSYDHIAFFLQPNKRGKTRNLLRKFFHRKDIVKMHRRSRSDTRTILHDDYDQFEFEFVRPRCAI